MTEPARISSLSELLPHVRDRFLMGQRDLRQPSRASLEIARLNGKSKSS